MRSVNFATSTVCFLAVAVVAGRSAMGQERAKQEAPMMSNNDRIQPYRKNPRYWQPI